LAGCESPADGSAGASGAIYLSGSLTSAGIQAAIDSGAPLVFAGVTQFDEDIVIVPAGRGVKLIGESAFTLHNSGLLVLEDASSIAGDGKIAGSGTGTVIAPEALKDKAVNAAFIKIQSGETIEPEEPFAVAGNITISDADTSETNIKNNEFDGTVGTLYVVGSVTVSAAIADSANIFVLNNATVSETQTEVINWKVGGTLTATKAPTAGAGAIYAKTLDVSGAGDTINLSVSGTVTVEELVTAGTVVITTGTGGLTADKVTGAAVFATGAKIDEAAFSGTVKFNDTATLGEVGFGGDVTVTNNEALTLASDKEVTLADGVSIKIDDTAPVTILTAGGKTVLTPAGDTTLTPAKTDKKLTLGAAGATLTSGKLTVAAGAELALGSALTLAPNTGGLVLSAADTTGAKISGTEGVAAGKTTITGIWQAVGASGTVTIAATGAATSSITASAAAAVLTAGTAGTITQAAEAGNLLTIAANTTIALGGDGTEVGKILLKGAAANSGELSFENSGSSDVGTSLVTTAVTYTAANKAAVTKIGGNEGTGTAIVGYFDNAAVTSATKFSKLGASNATNGIKGGGAGTDTELSGKTYTAADFGT
jgi:hypothetical protein